MYAVPISGTRRPAPAAGASSSRILTAAWCGSYRASGSIERGRREVDVEGAALAGGKRAAARRRCYSEVTGLRAVDRREGLGEGGGAGVRHHDPLRCGAVTDRRGEGQLGRADRSLRVDDRRVVRDRAEHGAVAVRAVDLELGREGGDRRRGVAGDVVDDEAAVDLVAGHAAPVQVEARLTRITVDHAPGVLIRPDAQRLADGTRELEHVLSVGRTEFEGQLAGRDLLRVGEHEVPRRHQPGVRVGVQHRAGSRRLAAPPQVLRSMPPRPRAAPANSPLPTPRPPITSSLVRAECGAGRG